MFTLAYNSALLCSWISFSYFFFLFLFFLFCPFINIRGINMILHFADCSHQKVFKELECSGSQIWRVKMLTFKHLVTWVSLPNLSWSRIACKMSSLVAKMCRVHVTSPPLFILISYWFLFIKGISSQKKKKERKHHPPTQNVSHFVKVWISGCI